LAGNLVRVSTLHRAAPWPLRAAFDAAELRAVLRRSVPLQASWTVGQLPTWITPTLVAVWLGPEAVGLLTFAFMLGRKPLELIENLIRVALAQFARLQHDAAEVERVLLRYATASVLVTGLWLAIVAIAGHDLVGFLYSDRWLPAVPALGLYAVSAVIGSLRGLASAALIATGRFVQIARISVVSTLVSLAVSCGLLLELGLVGVPLGLIAGALVALPWLLRALATGAATRLAGAALVGARPLGVACAAGMLALWIPGVRAAGGLPLLGVVAAAYLATAWWGGPGWLRSVAREELALPWAAITRAR
jgi:O-antigen/teichoic acid export membrane protein